MRDGLLALSVTNIVFFRRWAQLLPGGHDYFLAAPRPPVTYFSLMLLVVGLAALAWGIRHLAERSARTWPTRVVRVGFVAVTLFGLTSVLAEGWVLVGRPRLTNAFIATLFFVGAAALAWLTWKHRGWQRLVVPVAVTIVLLLAPLAPLLYVQGTYRAVATGAVDQHFAVDLAGPQPPGALPGRVVWIVLDELDQRLTFEERPPGYDLPQLERLRNESLYATHAYTPNGQTLLSIPSMLTGTRMTEASPHAATGLAVRPADHQKHQEFEELDTVFHDIRKAGGNTGVVGTYHPYCRLFASELAECRFTPHHADEGGSFGVAIEAHMMGLTRTVPDGILQSILLGPTGLREHVSLARQEREEIKYNTLVPAAIKAASNASLEFVFLHLNVPHPTGMTDASRGYFDAAAGRFVTGPQVTYFDNLVLADQTVGAIRSGMEAAGVWNNTTLIITADHGYRSLLWGTSAATERFGGLLHKPADHRVVFLLKPATAPQPGMVYPEPFNLVVMRSLVMEGLTRGLDTPHAAAAWLEGNRTIGAAAHYDYR